MLLQPLWTFLLDHSALMLSPVFPVVFSLSVYLSFCLPFLLLDLLSCRWALVRRYKLQPQSSVSWASVRSCLALTLYNHLVFIFPVTVLHWYLRPANLPAEAPPLPRLLAQVFVCLLLFDFQSFTWHLLHHKVPWLYRNFHKAHHTFTSTSALTTEHSGAWETLSLAFFAASTPLLLGVHPLTELAFFLLNIWLSVEDHGGYDLPCSTHRLVPFGLYGGARHHDLHHLKSKYNYAPYFTHWDQLAGTLYRWALVRRYKLQPQSSVSWASVRSCLALTLYNHLVFIFPVTVLHWYLRPANLPAEAPPLPRLLAQVFVCLLLFDFQSFTWHLLHHKVPWLYRNFHKAHHTFTSTSALTTEHSGAWETLSLAFFAASTPLLLGVHPLTELAFFLLNIWLSVEDHGGYDLPCSTHRLVPFGLYGGARHHDLHHLKSKYNYAPYFTHWDQLAGTLYRPDD